MAETPLVGVIMGSKSDLPVMEACTQQLEEFGVPYELVIASAHRNPAKVHEWASTAADRGLKVNPDNQLFLLAKSVAQLNLNQDNSCVATSQRLIELNDTLPEPYYNIAMVYLNKALMLEEQNEPRRNRDLLQQLYQLARPYMENYQRLAPDDQRRWAPALYRIYFNLNMGRQFDKIDKMMRKMK